MQKLNPFRLRRAFDPDAPEQIDRTWNDPHVLADNLSDLRRINKYFGSSGFMRASILRLMRNIPDDREVRILDVATGSADHPAEIARTLAALQRPFSIVAVDKNPQILEIASRALRGIDGIQLVEADALNLPFPPESFDIVICSLALHHFSDEDAVRLLQRMRALAKSGVVVNDLRRNGFAVAVIWLYVHIATRNPLTRSDSHLSILRAFTAEELAALARRAGLAGFKIQKKPFFRLFLTVD